MIISGNKVNPLDNTDKSKENGFLRDLIDQGGPIGPLGVSYLWQQICTISAD